MINGEGIQENSSGFPSSDLFDDFSPWLDKKLKHVAAEIASDHSPASSNYSSCEESEFERYCSANSIVGTPSICSSLGNRNEFLESELGSLRHFGFSEDSFLERSLQSGYESDGVSRRSHGGFDQRTTRVSENKGITVLTGFDGDRMESESGQGNGENDVDNENNGGVCMGEVKLPFRIRSGLDSLQISDYSSSSGNDVSWEKTDRNSSKQGVKFVDRKLSKAHVLDCSEYGVRISASVAENEMEILPDTDKSSSECGSLDDEDSVLGSGTDEENTVYVYERRDLPNSKGAENPLLLNSGVAFGSDDWDEFVLETGGNLLPPITMDKASISQQGHLDTERNFFEAEENVQDIRGATFHAQVIDGSRVFENASEAYSIRDHQKAEVGVVLAEEKDLQMWKPKAETFPLENVDVGRASLSLEEAHSNIKDGDAERELQCVCSEEVSVLNEVSEKQILDNSTVPLDPLSDVKGLQFYPTMVEASHGKEMGFLRGSRLDAFQLMVENGSSDTNPKKTGNDSIASSDPHEKILGPDEVKTLDVDESYDEMVHDMEEILLESWESHGARFTPGSCGSQRSQPFRDGSSTASTSGTDDVYPQINSPLKIDWIEVVGAKQKKGEVSFGERLVGVKEYTVYRIKVWSGKEQWEVERRYRDFCTLYRQLKKLFMDHGWHLASPWSGVERESRKIFGNASPDVISERSALIQECLQSVLHTAAPSFGTPSSLIWFLSPQKTTSNGLAPQKLVIDEKATLPVSREMSTEVVSTLGKTISLLVELQPRKPLKQLLEAQHYMCAGCYKRLDVGKTLVQEFVQTFGWGKPRLCEYTGQLFCASCHSNDTAVLPARVLHNWDFTMHPVSQLAKAYLESIYDQPMLCVSAVNPFLFSKVPTLLHVTGIRKEIGAMLPCVRCPFRRSIQRVLGSRRYLLESNDFFALRDLVDLSKGAFAGLPVMIETISRKILEHITQQCLVCCDMGEPCGARQSCEDPSYLIFPFQEAEAARCSSCGSVFHRPCFRKIKQCPCTAAAELDEAVGPMGQVVGSRNVLDDILESSSGGFISGLFSKSRKEKVRNPRNNPVILMGSLPSTSL